MKDNELFFKLIPNLIQKCNQKFRTTSKMAMKKASLHIYGVGKMFNILNVCIFHNLNYFVGIFSHLCKINFSWISILPKWQQWINPSVLTRLKLPHNLWEKDQPFWTFFEEEPCEFVILIDLVSRNYKNAMLEWDLESISRKKDCY